MSKWFKCTYHPFFGKDQKTGNEIEIFRPTIPIVMVYKDKPSWGELVGVNIKKGKMNITYGIGDNEVVVYTHKVKILLR